MRIQTAAYKDLVGAALVILAACGSSGGSGDKDAEGTTPTVTTVDSFDPNDQDQDGFTPAEGDCDDADPSTYPDAPDGCTGADNDCNGFADDGGYAATTDGTAHEFSIQDALDLAEEGSTVVVCPGVWPENLIMRQQSVHLRSLAGAATTTVDAEGGGAWCR